MSVRHVDRRECCQQSTMPVYHTEHPALYHADGELASRGSVCGCCDCFWLVAICSEFVWLRGPVLMALSWWCYLVPSLGYVHHVSRHFTASWSRDRRALKLKFHGSSFLLASSRGYRACRRGCYEETASVDFQLNWTQATHATQGTCVKFDATHGSHATQATHATQAPKNSQRKKIELVLYRTQATQAPTNQDAMLVKFPNSKNKSRFLLSLFYHFQSYNEVNC